MITVGHCIDSDCVTSCTVYTRCTPTTAECSVSGAALRRRWPTDCRAPATTWTCQFTAASFYLLALLTLAPGHPGFDHNWTECIVLPHCYYFYPHNAVLAWVLAVVMCLSVCLCVYVCHTLIFYRNGCTDWADFLCTIQVFLVPCYTIIILGYLQNNATSLWNFVPDFVCSTLSVDINSLFRRPTDRRLLIALNVQLCVQRLGTRQRHAGPVGVSWHTCNY